jgi:hypothetical protein
MGKSQCETLSEKQSKRTGGPSSVMEHLDSLNSIPITVCVCSGGDEVKKSGCEIMCYPSERSKEMPYRTVSFH